MFPILREKELNSRVDDFNALLRTMMVFNGRVGDAQAGIELRAVPARVRQIIERAEPGMISGSPPGWGEPLSAYSLTAGAVAESLRFIGVADAILAGGAKRVALRSRSIVSASTITGTEVAEGAPKPVSELVLQAADLDRESSSRSWSRAKSF